MCTCSRGGAAPGVITPGAAPHLVADSLSFQECWA